MDLDGVWAQLAFPNFARFSGHRFFPTNDPGLSLLCTQAYNDLLVDEWCVADPDRLIRLMLIPLWDVEASVREIERLAERAVRAVAFSENPTVLGLPSIHTTKWEPLFRSRPGPRPRHRMHIGSSSKQVTSSPDAPIGVQFSVVGVNSMVAMPDWFFSGILDRHPSLRVMYSQGGAGWVPYLLEHAERYVETRGGLRRRRKNSGGRSTQRYLDFLGFSYGFRPGRSPHDALDALTVGIERKRVNWVLNADV